MAVANLPFYSTSYGETFGYNEREGNNLSNFRNRYLNGGYRGSADLGPTRFNAARTAPAPASDLSATVPVNRPTFAATASLNVIPNTSRGVRQEGNGYTGHTVARDFGSYRPYEGISSSNVDPITTRPYYIPPPEPAPSAPFSGSYEFGSTSGSNSFVPSRHSGGVAQSIPSNRLTAAPPTSKTYRLSAVEPRPQPAYTNVEGRRPATPPYKKPTLTQEKQESMANYGKLSISRRLPEGERLRYHVPGYMGFVRSVQFRHGDTFGVTTRKCLTNYEGGL